MGEAAERVTEGAQGAVGQVAGQAGQAAQGVPKEARGEVKAPPSAERLARKLGVDLSGVEGTGSAVARALDVVGEQWTLLLVRELLTGPKRFKDLLDGLPGIGTTLLSARLKDLEGHGIVRRATLPPPAGSSVYELTDLGRSLDPVIMSLSRQGLRLLGTPRQEDDLQPGWAMVALQSTLNPPAAGGSRETYEFRVDDEVFPVRAEGDDAEIRQGPAVDPDLIVGGDTETFLGVAAGRLAPAEAVDTGAIRVEGDREAQARCLAMLGP